MLKKPRLRFNWWKLASYACAGIIGVLLGQLSWNSREAVKSANLLIDASNKVAWLTAIIKANQQEHLLPVFPALPYLLTNDIHLVPTKTNYVFVPTFTNEPDLFRVITNSPSHRHGYADWSEPQQAEDNYIIPQFYQWRKCAECGEIEFRKCLRSREEKSRL